MRQRMIDDLVDRHHDPSILHDHSLDHTSDHENELLYNGAIEEFAFRPTRVRYLEIWTFPLRGSISAYFQFPTIGITDACIATEKGPSL